MIQEEIDSPQYDTARRLIQHSMILWGDFYETFDKLAKSYEIVNILTELISGQGRFE